MKVEALFEWYRTTREWRKLAKNSKIMYDQMMKHTLARFDNVFAVTATSVDQWYDELVEQGKTHKAVSIMKVMRRIWNVAKRVGKVDNNPFEKMGLASIAPREQLWTKEIVEKFRVKALEENKPHIALLVDMCYNLGQRPGDVIGLSVKAYNQHEDIVVVKQQKTGKVVSIPIYAPFKGRLKAALKSVWVDRWGTFLPQINYSQYNRDYRYIRECLDLPKSLQLRDIRRTVMTEILDGGASDAEALAISGHSDRDMLNTYGKSTIKMARSAMEKRGLTE